MDACLSADDLAAMVDGTLDAARFARAEKHVSECEACMRLLQQVGRALTGSEDARPWKGAVAWPELARGTLVGRYEIEEPLGAGGMGRVYAARDPALDRRVALKLLHPSKATEELEARLLREAKAMARLQHPDVITIYDVGHYGEQLFIAMELVQGGTLRQWLAASPRTWREVLSLYVRAGRGLARAHAAGIIHRDFKPDNVLVDSEGGVRVTDFGLASTAASGEPAAADVAPAGGRGEASLTRTGMMMGTPAYMAPEQHRGAPADARSDIYAFCVSLHEALCGERPFTGGTAIALLDAKLTGRVGSRPAGRNVPLRLLQTIAIGLRPRAEDRYASMDATLAALERAARVRRWPLALATAGVIVAAAGVALGARHRPPPPQASAAGCSSNRACVEANAGEPFVCRPSDRACVRVASEDCVPKLEPQDLASEDTVWLGALFPTKGPSADFGAMNMDSAELARREIAQATKAFDGSSAAQRVRRIALVQCDDSVDAARAARHLVDDVGVPAIFGFSSGQEVIDLAGSMLIKRGVVSIAVSTANPLVTRLPHPPDSPRLVWRTTYNMDGVALAIAGVIEQVLAPRYARAPMRVTLLRGDSLGAASFAEKLSRSVRFNGVSAIENGSLYSEVTLPPRASAADVQRAVDRVVDSEPSVLVLQGDESIVSVVERVEDRMSGHPRRPTFVGALVTLDKFASFLAKNAERRKRLYAIESLSNSPTNARFVLSYNETHARKVTRTINGGVTYDAFYVLAYGTFALGQSPMSGPALARAFSRLVGPGPQIQVGAPGVIDAITALGRGDNVDLEGTQSGLDFDLATGDEPSDFALLCSDVDAHGRPTGEDLESGIVYRSRTGKVEGALRCP